ncbi:MAG: hypothetical protein WKF75_13750 [Singulisphaera sp.]
MTPPLSKQPLLPPEGRRAAPPERPAAARARAGVGLDRGEGACVLETCRSFMQNAARSTGAPDEVAALVRVRLSDPDLGTEPLRAHCRGHPGGPRVVDPPGVEGWGSREPWMASRPPAGSRIFHQ